MKTSTEIASIAKVIGEEKAVEAIAKAGFDAWDFSMTEMANIDWEKNVITYADHPLGRKDYLKFARKLKQIGEDNGICCNQSHAPFPTIGFIREECVKRALECTAEVGGEICVIHPDCYASVEQNIETYQKLLEFAKPLGVKIATENMWAWDNEKDHAFPIACSDHKSFKEYFDLLNDQSFVACVDIGHAEMRGLGTNSVQMILTLKDKVQALHIHDNDLHHDSHAIPYSMKMDFSPIVRALKEINYKGYFTLEAVSFMNSFNTDNAFDGVKQLYASIRKMADEFESL